MCGWMIQNHCTRSTTKAPNSGADTDWLVSCRMYMPALPWNRKWRFSKMKWCQKFSWQQEVAALWKTNIALTLCRNMCKRWHGCVHGNICVVALWNSKHWYVRCLNEHMCVSLFRPRSEYTSFPEDWLFTLSRQLHTVDTLECHTWLTCPPSSARALCTYCTWRHVDS